MDVYKLHTNQHSGLVLCIKKCRQWLNIDIISKCTKIGNVKESFIIDRLYDLKFDMIIICYKCNLKLCKEKHKTLTTTPLIHLQYKQLEN